LGPDTNLFATLGLFAPTIRCHKGVFYIICTNARRNNADELSVHNFYVTCRNIWADEWSDPIWFDFEGIDPSLFFDHDDRVYVQGSHREGAIEDQLCSIRQFEIELVSGRLLSDVKVLWDNGGAKSDIEGPHIYKKDGYYYLLVADGGTFEHHKASIARSRDIWGPFEVYEKNPVLTADNTDEYIQHVGHADLFQDGSGKWWAVALGVRNENGRYPMGRETFLIPVEWPTGDWPSFGWAKTQFHRDGSPGPVGKMFSPKSRARVEDVYIRDAKLDDYQFSPDGGLITLIPRRNDLSAPKNSASFIGKRQRSQSSTATMTLHVPKHKGIVAGLALYKDDFRHVTSAMTLTLAKWH
jgi:beta-xylosidase